MNPYDLENLKTLEIGGNFLTTTNGIFFPGLIRLYLGENQIERLEGLEILVNLKILHLRSNKISNLSGFDARCAKLNYLNLRDSKNFRVGEIKLPAGVGDAGRYGESRDRRKRNGRGSCL